MKKQKSGLYEKSLIRIILFLCINFIHFPLYGYYFKNIGVKDGLSQPSILSIHQDELGRMWFGTLQGLSIYDGNEMITLKGGEERFDNYIKNNTIYRIVEDSNHNIFLRADNSLVCYKLTEDRFQCIRERDINAVNSIGGKIYIAAKDSILEWNEGDNRWDFFKKIEISSGRISSIFCNRSSEWYIVTSKGCYKEYKNGLWKCILDIPSIEMLYESKDGSIWMATRSNGLYQFDNDICVNHIVNNPGTANSLCSNDVRVVTEDQSGNLWIGTREGLNKYSISTGNIESYASGGFSGDMKHSSIFALYLDKEGGLWVGTYYGGVSVFSPESRIFKYYPANKERSDCLNFPFVSGIVKDKRDDLWICTDGGGLNYMNHKTEIFRHLSTKDSGLVADNMKSICYDKNKDKLYIGTYLSGLIAYDIPSGKFTKCFKSPKDRVLHHTVTHVYMYGDKIVFSSSDGIYVFNEKTNEVTPLLCIKGVLAFVIDQSDQIWAIYNKNIVCMKIGVPDSMKRYQSSDFGIKHNVLLCICETSNGEIYVGTEGGGMLGYNAKEDTFQIYNSKNSLILDDYCFNCISLDERFMVIMCSNGLSFFDTKEKRVKYSISGKKLPVSSFGVDNGLYVSENKDIYAGSLEGLAAFSVDNLKNSANKKSLYLSKLFVNNALMLPNDSNKILKRIISYTDKIVLKHNQNNLEFTFSDNDFYYSIFPTFYEYKLDGLDKKWIKTNGHHITYTNIPPGNYTLHIRENNIYGNEQDEGISLDIVVKLPWWNTWWAWLIYFIIVLSILFIIAKEKITSFKFKLLLDNEKREKENIEKINRFKLDFFTNVSHELRTPLTLITTQIELLLSNSKDISKPVYDKILKLHKHASDMRNQISELLDFHKLDQKQMRLSVQEKNLIPFLDEVYLSFKEQAEAHNIKYLFTTSCESAFCWFDSVQLRKVFSNLISNALKFTNDNGSVELSLIKNNEMFIIRLIDNGIGIEAGEIDRIFERYYQSKGKFYTFSSGIGLALCKEIINLHHGKITVESKPGYGSIFSVMLKTGNEHFINDPLVDIQHDIKESKSIVQNSIPDSDFMKTLKENNKIVYHKNDPDEADVRRILIVEDNVELLNLLAEIFSPLYQVYKATNGDDGLIITIKEQPDIVLSDVMMPGISGNEMCRRIKNNIHTCHIPVVLLTARISPEQQVEGLMSGADDYITKSFNAKILLIKINNILRNRELLHHTNTDNSQSTNVPGVVQNESDKKLLDKIKEIVEKNIENPDFNIEQLASEVCMGRSAFFEKIKDITGTTPANFILECRLNKATALLIKNPTLRMDDIAAYLGFSSGRYFCKCFKNHFGISPLQYRKQDQG